MLRDAVVKRRLSNVALVALLAFEIVTTIGSMVSLVRPHGTYGLRIAWQSVAPNMAREAIVTRIRPGSPAARAGLAPGDRVVAFPSFADRVALMLQSNLPTGYYLAPGQSTSLVVARGRRIEPVVLKAAPAQAHSPLWLLEVRLLIFLIGVLIAGALVALRPGVITWSFALFVMLGAEPNILQLELIGMLGSPLAYLVALVALVPCAGVVGFLGLIAFAARFPEKTPHPGYRPVERFFQLFMAIVVAAYAEYYVGALYGWPAAQRTSLNYVLFFVPSVIAVVLMTGTLLRSQGADRVRLRWALAGPALGMAFTFANTSLVALRAPFAFPATFGLLSSVAPFAMVYAILRHRVIDIGFALDRHLAEAVARGTTPAGVKLERRDLVRRATLLFSTSLPLHDVYAQLASLLATFVDAGSVLIAVGNASQARLEYNFEAGAGGRPDDATVPADSIVGRVLRDGKPILLRRLQDWPSSRIVSVDGKQTQDSESGIFVPILFGGESIGVISVQSLVADAYDEGDVSLLETCALYLGARIHDERSVPNAVLPVPLSNQATFDEALRTRWQRCAREDLALSVLLVDVDLFSAFNEIYGHVAGDTCLRQIGRAIAACGRPGDVVARYASNEFAILMPQSDATSAARTGERIRDAVGALSIVHQGSSLGHLTVSVGVASYVPASDATEQQILAQVAAQIARAKANGRNRVVGETYESQAEPATRATTLRHDLPIPQTAFFGRETSIAGISDALSSHAVVTITGPSGSGKTRTALETARREAQRYPDGLWFVDLGGLAAGSHVAQAVVSALFPRLDIDADATRWEDLFGDKQLLLVLDDCSHLRPACAQLAAAIAQNAPGVRMLATSDLPLTIHAESVHPLPPLDADYTLELFLDRAKPYVNGELSNDPETAEQIARRLAGVPLAAEVAAAQLRIFSPTQLLAGLDPLREAQSPLAAVLDAGYVQLHADAQATMRTLGVFGDNCTPQAVAACAQPALSPDAATAALQALADRSLVYRAEGLDTDRFVLPRAVRDYAIGHLKSDGTLEPAGLAHARYFASHARELFERKRSFAFNVWSSAQRAALDNYRVALRYAFTHPAAAHCAAEILRSLGGMLGELAPLYDFSSDLRKALADPSLANDTQAAFWMAMAELRRLKSPSDSLRAARRAYDLFGAAGDTTGRAYAA
ncbi:MAG TPA: diguanylate cyclase, partial [Candidatus Baltobacteraceae bacterium]|nr:diguanylate cyclase [Candidatus Baltobacteraceae bacterium]